MHARTLATKERGAGGVWLARVGELTRQSDRENALDEGRESASYPLGVDTGEAWNRSLSVDWRSELALNGTIGGVRLA